MTRLQQYVRDIFSRSTHSRVRRIERRSYGSRATYVGNNRVLVRCFVGKFDLIFYVEADDRLLAPWMIAAGIYEPGLSRYFCANVRPSDNCIDVGANLGYFTCLMAKLAPMGSTIGIEPTAITHGLLRDNILINGLSNAFAENKAASDHVGELTIHKRDTRSGNNSIAPVERAFTDMLGERPIETFVVATTRVDDIALKVDGPIDFMKIDVEGAEPLVVRGSNAVIQRNDDISIVMEWSPGQIQTAGFDVRAFTVELAELGLAPFDIGKGKPSKVSFEELLHMDYQPGVLLRKKPLR